VVGLWWGCGGVVVGLWWGCGGVVVGVGWGFGGVGVGVGLLLGSFIPLSLGLLIQLDCLLWFSSGKFEQ
jgi:hypothetical protein